MSSPLLTVNRLLLTADLQLHNHTAFSTVTDQGFNSRLLDGIAALDQIVQHAEPDDAIVILGDIFEAQKAVETPVVQAFANWLARVTPKHHVVLVAGNHDHYYRNGSFTSLHPFTLAHNVTVVEKPTTLNFVFDGFHAHRAHIHPYVDNEQEVKDWLAAQTPDPESLLLLHQSVNGAMLTTSTHSSGLLSPEDLRPDDFALTYLGHFHRPQALGERAFYLGSPYQVTAEEAGQRKRFVVVSSEAGKLKHTSVPVTGPEFVKLASGEFLEQANAGVLRKTDYHIVYCSEKADTQAIATTASTFGLDYKIQFTKGFNAQTSQDVQLGVLSWPDAVKDWLGKRDRSDLLNTALKRLSA